MKIIDYLLRFSKGVVYTGIIFAASSCSSKITYRHSNPDGIVCKCEETVIGGDECRAFTFHLSKIPEKKPFSLVAVDLIGNSATYDMYSDEHGDMYLTALKSKKLLRQCKIIPRNVGKGEPLFCYIVSDDMRTCLENKIIGKPFQAEGKDGAIVSFSFNDPARIRFLIDGRGFLPKEELTVYCEGLPDQIEDITEHIEASEEGTFSVPYMNCFFLSKEPIFLKIKIIRKSETIELEAVFNGNTFLGGDSCILEIKE